METDDQMIRALLAEPPATAHAVAVARRRLTDEINAEPAPGRGRRALRVWRWSLAGGGLAGLAAAGLALVMTAGPTPPPRLGEGGGTAVAAPPGPAADASPELLLVAAARAEDTLGTGKYWRVLTVTESGPLPVRTGPEPYLLTQREAAESWTAREPDGQSWDGYQQLGARPRAEADRAVWVRAGSPRTFDLGPADSPSGGRSTRSTDPSPGVLHKRDKYPEYDSVLGPLALAKLPTDPQALHAAVVALIERNSEGGSEPTPAETDYAVFTLLSGLLTDAPAAPALRSAAFLVLSDLPGVDNAGPAQDAAGRSGIALELRQEQGRHASALRLILDATTYRLLGTAHTSGELGADGKIDPSRGKEGSTVQLKAEWTDQQPVAPALR